MNMVTSDIIGAKLMVIFPMVLSDGLKQELAEKLASDGFDLSFLDDTAEGRVYHALLDVGTGLLDSVIYQIVDFIWDLIPTPMRMIMGNPAIGVVLPVESLANLFKAQIAKVDIIKGVPPDLEAKIVGEAVDYLYGALMTGNAIAAMAPADYSAGVLSPSHPESLAS